MYGVNAAGPLAAFAVKVQETGFSRMKDRPAGPLRSTGGAGPGDKRSFVIGQNRCMKAAVLHTINMEVSPLAKKYPGLNSLIDQDMEAREYFESLPDYVQASISERGDHVNSLASLQDYAENLLRGDD